MAKFVWLEDKNEITTPKTRSSNLELLRIICMLFIIAHHFGVHSDFAGVLGFNSFVVSVFKSCGKLAVNTFVLITGYFTVNSRFKIKKLINIISLTVFYNVIIYITVTLSTGSSIKFIELVKSFFPIRYNSYWFVTCFIAMLLLSPFINKLIHALTHVQHIILIVLLVLMQAYVPSIDSYFAFSETAWFITLYLIGAYLHKYPNKITSSTLITGIFTTVFCTVVMLWNKTTSLKDLFCLTASVSLFCLFNSFSIGCIKPINFIAKTTFGIYIIHDNRLIRPLLWNKILSAPAHASLDSFWLFAPVAVLTVFVCCMLIEFIRLLFTSLIFGKFKKVYRKHHPNKQ